jgi:hypothetical protein
MNTTLPELTDAAQQVDLRRSVIVFTAAICMMTVPATYYHGMVLQRWGEHETLALQVAALDALPAQVGNWRYVADGEPLSEDLQSQLELRGYSHRVYEHVSSGQRVTLLMLVGPAGPLVRHPPEICYGSRANQLVETREMQVDTDRDVHTLRLLSYAGDSMAADDFLIAYGFGLRGRWDCPESPRIAYGGEPVLIKLQALTDQLGESSVQGLAEFLSQMLPPVSELMAE